jgi:predicted Zn-dependent peptidase
LPDLGPRATVAYLPAGGLSIVEPLAGAPVAAVELWYRAPSTGFGTTPVPTLARLAAQVVAASKPLVGPSLGELVKSSGGRLSITVYNESVEIAAVVPANVARSVVKTMTTVYFAPVLDQTGFQVALRDVEQEAIFESFNPETVARDAVFGALFQSGPQHYPALGDPRTIGSITLADARGYATRAFRSQNAILVVSGDVDRSVVGAAATGRPAEGNLANPESPAAIALAPTPEPITKAFDEPSGGYGWIGPPIADEKAATAMDFIADYLFGGDTGTVTRVAGEKDPSAFIVGQFVTLHDPGVLFVAYSGKDPVALRTQIEAGVSSIERPLPAAAFASALIAFRYHLLRDLQTPGELADNFGWYAVEGNAEYAPGASGDSGQYFRAIDALTPSFVAQVATQYLQHPAVVTLEPSNPAPAPSPAAPAPPAPK